MNKLNQKGIAAVIVVVILLAVGAIGFVGWRVFESRSDSTGNQQISPQPDNNTESKTTQNTGTEEAATGAVITTGESEFGEMLFDDKKQAIYIWEVEKSTKAECYGDCAKAWPPVLTDGAPRATGGVNTELLGTTERTDGTTQVTYNGHPLYYYADEEPGEVKCHNVSTHGGLWWVIQPNGNRAD